ncbi:unnamed protein product [Cladocopium goreaui]|uniref:Voltage-dependent L-type calcium channel subunit alpha-1S n=1 Tax=Cladocopium goreaui TaxID=2562237 RepID=A0A9P1D698_9DINO|nr:unnamed protein product [Cladocopium goreaui]
MSAMDDEAMHSVLQLADVKFSEMSKELCQHVAEELHRATGCLVREVEEKLRATGLTLSPSWHSGQGKPARGKTVAWEDEIGVTEFKSFLSDEHVHTVNSKYFEDLTDSSGFGSSEKPQKPIPAWGTKISPEAAGDPPHPDRGSIASTTIVEGSETETVKTMKTVKTVKVEAPEDHDAPEAPRSNLVKLKTAKSMKVHQESMAERVFGFVPDLNDTFTSRRMSGCQKKVRSLISSNLFEVLAMFMIMLNSLQVGLQINHLAETTALDAGPVWRAFDLFFCAWFTLEVSLKLYVYRCRSFTMHGCAWNILDFFLNAVQIFEEIVALVFLSFDNAQTVVNSGVMRTVRILRGIKVMRLVRTVRFAEELQLIVSCLILSVRTFLCVVSLLFMWIYVMAIYTTQAVYVHRLENSSGSGDEDLVRWWGNIPTSMLSLFQALSGGVDWNDISKPLSEHISPWFGYLLVVFIAYCFLALLNVTTGTFVEAVSRQAEHLKIRAQIIQARKVFQQIDSDHSGSISLLELRNQTMTPAVLEFFDYVNVDPSEAQYLLEVLDGDGSGTIAFDEFLQGTLRLNCSARAADMLLVVREIKRFFVHYNAEMQLIKRRLGII